MWIKQKENKRKWRDENDEMDGGKMKKKKQVSFSSHALLLHPTLQSTTPLLPVSHDSHESGELRKKRWIIQPSILITQRVRSLVILGFQHIQSMYYRQRECWINVSERFGSGHTTTVHESSETTKRENLLFCVTGNCFLSSAASLFFFFSHPAHPRSLLLTFPFFVSLHFSLPSSENVEALSRHGQGRGSLSLWMQKDTFPRLWK